MRAPASRTAASVSSIAGHSERAAGSRSLTHDRLAAERQDLVAARAAPRPARRRRAAGQAVGLAEDGGRRERGGDGSDEHAVRARRRGSGRRCSPAPVARTRPGRTCATARRRRARRRARRAARRRPSPERAVGEPQRRGGVGRAAAHPGRDRDPLVDRQAHRRPRPSPSPRGTRRAPRPRGSGPRRPGRRPRPPPPPRTASACRRARAARMIVTSSWRPSARASARGTGRG